MSCKVLTLMITWKYFTTNRFETKTELATFSSKRIWAKKTAAYIYMCNSVLRKQRRQSCGIFDGMMID